MPWQPPNLTLRWGEYFHPDADDDTKLVNMTVAAKNNGLITERSAVEAVQHTFRIDNVDEYLKTLGEEREAKQKQLAADMHAMGGDEDDDDKTDDSDVDGT